MGDDEENKQSLGNQLKEAGKQKAKSKGKQIAKKILKKAMPFIIPIILGLIVVSCLIALTNIVKETAQGVINTIVDFFKGDQTYIELDDEKLDELINLIEATGIDLEDLELLR